MTAMIRRQGDSVVIYADTYQEAAEFYYGLVADGKIEDSGFTYGGNK